ncbi:MAG TPA: pirin family protein [Thermoanaerobaculia bacterium]|nr:pirin family protein [Thermoanaerobaculia bacterium]
MINVRKSDDRGVGRHGWLLTKHTFSFARYWDEQHMGFRSLRVINEDTVAPAQGFGAHQHDNMEIISIVMEGALAHKDSTGGDGVLRRGEVQRMSAGTGVVHSEFNGSDKDPVHFFQIWIEPAQENVTPGYEQKLFPEEERRGTLRLLASPGAEDGALKIHQDARVYSAILDEGQTVEHRLGHGRGAWLQVARGGVTLNDVDLKEGDGAAVENEDTLTISGSVPASEILLFDLK